jgi:hypothetical protein
MLIIPYLQQRIHSLNLPYVFVSLLIRFHEAVMMSCIKQSSDLLMFNTQGRLWLLKALMPWPPNWEVPLLRQLQQHLLEVQATQQHFRRSWYVTYYLYTCI